MAVRCEKKKQNKKTSDQNPRRGSDCGNEQVSKTRDGKVNQRWGRDPRGQDSRGRDPRGRLLVSSPVIQEDPRKTPEGVVRKN